MATSVSVHFITQFQEEIHILWEQRMGFFLDTVMTVRGVVGDTVRFPVLAGINAEQKARHAEWALINPAHTTVSATMEDWGAPIPVEKFDELKTNVSWRSNYQRIATNALVREADRIVIDALTTGNTSTSGGSTVDLELQKIQTAIKTLDENNVPTNDRWAIISPHQWQVLSAIDQFSNADFVGGAGLTFPNGSRAKNWMGINWRMATNVPGAGTTNESCFMYQQDSVGLGIGMNITTEIDFIPMRRIHLINSVLSMASVVIDPSGVTVMPCTSTTALGT